jgi:hypothetical protein
VSTATAPTDLERLRQQEAELVTLHEQVTARLRSYPEIREERERSIFVGRRPLETKGSPLAKLLADDRKDAEVVRHIEADLSAVRSVIEREDVRVREQKVAEARELLEQSHEKAEQAWKRAGGKFAELVKIWNEIIELDEEAARIARAGGIQGQGIAAVEPTPETFGDLLGLLVDVCLDPTGQRRTPDYEEQLVDSGPVRTETGELVHRIRRAGTRLVQVCRPADHRDRLFHLLPNLRGRA